MGQSAAFTGPAAQLGVQFHQDAKLYFDQVNAQGGVGIFSRENMAMMIVERERNTKGMTEDQAKAARQEEMAKDRAETPDQRQARKARYDSEWMQLTAAEKQDAMTKLDAQMKARGMMAAPPAAK